MKQAWSRDLEGEAVRVGDGTKVKKLRGRCGIIHRLLPSKASVIFDDGKTHTFDLQALHLVSSDLKINSKFTQEHSEIGEIRPLRAAPIFPDEFSVIDDPVDQIEPSSEVSSTRASLADALTRIVIWLSSGSSPNSIAGRVLCLCAGLRIAHSAAGSEADIARFCSRDEPVSLTRQSVSLAGKELERAFGIRHPRARTEENSARCSIAQINAGKSGKTIGKQGMQAAQYANKISAYLGSTDKKDVNLILFQQLRGELNELFEKGGESKAA